MTDYFAYQGDKGVSVLKTVDGINKRLKLVAADVGSWELAHLLIEALQARDAKEADVTKEAEVAAEIRRTEKHAYIPEKNEETNEEWCRICANEWEDMLHAVAYERHPFDMDTTVNSTSYGACKVCGRTSASPIHDKPFLMVGM